jgi:hypothetical protein
MRTLWPLSLMLWVALGTACVAALLTTVGALFPGVVARARAAVEGRPGRAFAVGLVNGIFLVALGLALRVLARRAGLPVWPVTLPALVLLGVGLALGCAAVAGLVGERAWPVRSAAQQRAFGAGLATLGSLVPIVGWFVLLPYVLALGLGGAVLALLGRPQAVGGTAPAAPPASDTGPWVG